MVAWYEWLLRAKLGELAELTLLRKARELIVSVIEEKNNAYLKNIVFKK